MPRTPIPFDLVHSPVHLLHRAIQQAEAIFAADVAEQGLSLTSRQLAVLSAIDVLPGASQTDLVATTGVDRSTLSAIMKRLEERGLTDRQRAGADRRAYAVRLTPAGAAELRAALPVRARIDTAILQSLSAKRRAEFIRQLNRVVNALSLLAGPGGQSGRH